MKINIELVAITGISIIATFLMMYGITSRSGFTFSAGMAFAIGIVVYTTLKDQL